MAGWLENYNDSKVSAPEGFEGEGYSMKGRNYSPAWGGSFQMGGSVYPVNYVPQAQNGWLGDIEGSVNKSLGNPMRKGINAGDVFGEKWFNPKTKKWEIEGRDNIRHSFSGRYTSEAIQDKLHNVPILSQLAGTIGSTALGVGHELSTLFNSKDDRGWYDKIRESGEDAFNNTVGAVVGSLPISSETKTNTLGKLSNENRLPDGVSGRANSVYMKHAMGGSIPGAVGFSYARTQSPAPSNGKYAKKTLPSAQDGLDSNKLLPPPKNINKPKDVRKPGESIKLSGFTNPGEVNYAPYTPTLKGLNKAKTKTEKEATKKFIDWYSDPATKAKFQKNTGFDPERMQDLIGKGLNTPMSLYDRAIKHDWPMEEGADAAYKSAWVSQQQGDPTAPKTGYISYLPQGADIPEMNVYSRPLKDMIGHELAHASGFDSVLAPALYRALGLKLPTKAEQPDLAYPSRYMQRPEEVYGNFHELRLNLGLTPGEKVDRESLKKRVKADPHNATNFWDYYSKDPKTGKEDDKKIDKIVKAINTVAQVESTQQDSNIQTAQNGKEMSYYQNGLDWKPKSISRDGAQLDKAQTGAKKFKLKDERDLAYKPAESTNIKKKNFDLEQDKERKNYLSQLADQQKENSRRKKLTQDQREREDYNARSEQTGTISKYVPESTWDRSKAIASNPLTAFGYAARNESLPTRFQYGERNTLDNAIDWINPLQGVAALSEIPGELGRGEYLNAGLSLLDAVDLGVYAKGAMKTSKPLLQKAGKALTTEEGLLSNAYKLNPWAFKPNPEAYYRGIGKSGFDQAMETGVIGGRPNSTFGEDVYMSSMLDVAKRYGKDFRNPFNKNFFVKGAGNKTSYIAEIPRTSLTNPNSPIPYNVGTNQYPTYFHEFKNPKPIPLDDVKLLKEHWLQGYKEVPKQEDGGIIKDDNGYWNPDNWGKVVEIGSTDITMEGVDQPLLGISDTGDVKLMKPGKNYKFKGKKVTEYPMAKNGMRQEQKGLQNLDNLTNFTNYNKPQPGGWLNKYN